MNAAYMLEAGSVSRCLAEPLVSVGNRSERGWGMLTESARSRKAGGVFLSSWGCESCFAESRGGGIGGWVLE
jgi:hypothetical protein